MARGLEDRGARAPWARHLAVWCRPEAQLADQRHSMGHVPQIFVTDMCVDMCACMCIDICTEICTDTCTGIYAHM